MKDIFKQDAPGSTGFSKVVSDFGIGALKGVVKSATGAVDTVKKGLDYIADKAVGGQRTENLQEIIPQQAFTPSNTAQKAGFASEQIAEFFLPGGITKGARASLKLSTAPDILKILARGAMGAGESAAVTAIQGGTPEQVGKAARAGATFDAVPASVSKLLKSKSGQAVTKWLTEQIPSRLVNSILRPPEKAFSFGRNPGLGVANEGITANSRGDLLMKIGRQKERIGEAIGQKMTAADQAGTAIDWTPALKPIDDAVEHAVKTGQKDLVRQLLDLKDGLTQEYKLVGRDLVETGSKPTTLSATLLQQMKIEVGQSTRWTGQAFDNDLNRVRVSVYRELDSMLDDAVDGVEELNGRYANLLTAEKALEKSNNQMQKLVLAGLKVSGFGGAMTATSLMQGDSGPEALAKGVAAGVATKFAGSTPVKTRAARILNSMKPSEREALIEVMPTLRNVILGTREKGE